MLEAIDHAGAADVGHATDRRCIASPARLVGPRRPDFPRICSGSLLRQINSPQQVTLMDAAHVLYSDEGGIEIDTTDQATIQMDSAPTDPAVAATVFTSLWDNNLWAVKSHALDRVAARPDRRGRLHDGDVLAMGEDARGRSRSGLGRHRRLGNLAPRCARTPVGVGRGIS